MLAIFQKHKLTLLYGCALAISLLVLKWLEAKYIIYNQSFEIYAGIIALLFTALGIWIAIKLIQPKTIVVEKEVFKNDVTDVVINSFEIEKLGLSKREIEVLNMLATGLSNQEIGNHLYISLATVKTHVSKLYDKLDVKRLTQAIEKAKRLGIIS
ncbi:response regulator transcription factor [Parasediminibacterium paludis]|uniref:Response regulator transcription factor n=1 Tax=Parasediminibacterium paludis TaxID=908966 RepID=A0ABV8PW25_9BACT